MSSLGRLVALIRDLSRVIEVPVNLQREIIGQRILVISDVGRRSDSKEKRVFDPLQTQSAHAPYRRGGECHRIMN